MFPRHTNLRVSHAFLRLLVLSSIGWLATVWQKSVHNTETVSSIVVTVLILLHCLVGAWVLRSSRLIEFLDLLFTVAETLAFVFLNRALFKHPSTPIQPWASQVYIFYVAIFYIQIFSLGVIISLHVYSLRFGERSTGNGLDDMKPWAIILGRFLFESRDALYNSRHIQILRSVSAAVLVLVLLVFIFFAIIILPVHEGGLVPIKEYRTDNMLTDNPGMQTPVLSVFAIMNLANPAARNVELFKAAVNVTPLWNEDSPLKPLCEHVVGSTTFNSPSGNVPSLPYIQTIKIVCPSRYAMLGRNPTGYETFTLPSPWTFPDLLVTVDFAMLGISAADALIDARLKTVSIVVGMAANDSDVLSTTPPIPIYPESRMLGSIGFSLRRKYLKPLWATFASALAPQRTFFVCEILSIMPDPSSLIPRSNTAGTLRLYGQDDNSEWRVNSDHREHDIFGGIGTSGGFWTSINGIFAVFFGSHLLWVITGSKPLSIFGLAQSGGTTRKQLVSSFPKKGHNPHIESDRFEDFDVDAFIWQRLRESVNCGPFESFLANDQSPGPFLPTSGRADVGGRARRSSDHLELEYMLQLPSGGVFKPAAFPTVAAGYTHLGDDGKGPNNIELDPQLTHNPRRS